jgi:hypothetical protein
MNIIYFVIGKNPLPHAQTCFSIYLFLNQTNSTDRVYVITDDPERSRLLLKMSITKF